MKLISRTAGVGMIFSILKRKIVLFRKGEMSVRGWKVAGSCVTFPEDCSLLRQSLKEEENVKYSDLLQHAGQEY